MSSTLNVFLPLLAQPVLIPAEQTPDRGVWLLIISLLISMVLAHKFWRQRRRLEGEFASLEKDKNFYAESYRAAWSRLQAPCALVDRVSGRVLRSSQGWKDIKLPQEGERLNSINPSVEDLLASLKPTENSLPPSPVELRLNETPFMGTPLAGDALGMVLFQPK